MRADVWSCGTLTGRVGWPETRSKAGGRPVPPPRRRGGGRPSSVTAATSTAGSPLTTPAGTVTASSGGWLSPWPPARAAAGFAKISHSGCSQPRARWVSSPTVTCHSSRRSPQSAGTVTVNTRRLARG